MVLPLKSKTIFRGLIFLKEFGKNRVYYSRGRNTEFKNKKGGYMQHAHSLEQPNNIENRIFIVRGQKVMMDRDLAELFGVETRHLNRQVRRNIKRFPKEFAFQLTRNEKNEVVPIWHHLRTVKFSRFLPYVFTEHGVAMLATVLNSEQAIRMSIAIIQTFVKLRETLAAHKELALKLRELENRIEKHDEEIAALFDAIRELMAPPAKPKREIGFHTQ